MKIMKRLASMLLILAMVLSMAPAVALTASAAEYTGTGTFTQHTGAITSGYYVFGGGSTTSVSAINNTVGSSWIRYTATTVSSGTITNPSTNIVWYFDASTGVFSNGSNYIYWPTTDNTGGVGTARTPVTVTETSTSGIYNITVTATPARYLRLNGTNGYRFYASNTGTNTFYFYKLEEAGTSYIVTAEANNSAYGTASLSGSTITATPSNGYTVTGNYTVSPSGAVEVTYNNDNTFTVGTATEDCTITIEFAAKTAATLNYSENGVLNSASGYYVGDTVLLADPMQAAPDGYVFVGWSAVPVSSTDTAPEMITEVTLSAAITTVYAVYAVQGEGSGSGSTDYVLTDLADISASDEVIITMTNSSGIYAMENNNSTSAAPTATEVTVSNNIVTSTVTDALLWNISNFNGNLTIYPNGTSATWLYCTSTNNGVRVGTNNANVFVIDSASGYLKHSGTGRYLGVYNSADWRCYTSSTTTNIANQTLAFYVKSADGGVSYSGYTTTVSTAVVTYTLTYATNTTDSITGLPEAVSGITEGTEYTLSTEEPVREGYYFVGWALSDSSEDTVTSVTIDSDITVYAVWLAKTQYTVSYYDSDSGAAIATKTYYEDEVIAAEDVPGNYQVVEGFTFVGWYNATYDAETAPTYLTPAGTAVNSDLTYRAVYAEAGEGGASGILTALNVDDTVILISQGTSSEMISIGVGGAYGDRGSYSGTPNGTYVLEVVAGSDDGSYAFKNGSYYVSWGSGNTLTTSTILNANSSWNVTFDASGNATIKNVADSNRLLQYNSGSPRFAAYSSTQTAVQLYGMGGGTVGYTTNPVALNRYTIIWSVDGEIYTTSSLKDGTQIIAPEIDPTKADDETNHKYYEFLGWSESENGTIMTTFPEATADDTYYAVFQEHSYVEVNWDIDGDGTDDETEYYKDGETPAHEDPTKTSDGAYSYTFTGWDPAITAVAEGETYTYTAQFEQTELVYVASLSLDKASIKEGRSTTASGTLTLDGAEVTGYTPVYTSTNTTVATVDASTGKVSGVAVGTADIVVTYTVGTKQYTAKQIITVVADTGSTSGYTLITQENAPDDFSGDYIIMGRIAGYMDYLNQFQIMTPYWIDSTTAIVEDGESNSVLSGVTGSGTTTASNNASEVTLTINGDVATGTIDDVYGYDPVIEMESTGENDFVGSDGATYTVFDRITSVDDSYVFTIELVDDINGYYTIRIKGTSYYLANTNTTTSGNNGMQYVLNATTDDTTALWYIRWATESDGLNTNSAAGYTPDQIMIESVYGVQNNVSRAILFNNMQGSPTSSSIGNSRFRVYGENAYNNNGNLGIAPNDTNGTITYNLQLFGNPNPFNAQIYYMGDQKTIANPVELPEGMTVPADLESALVPDIIDYPAWSISGGPVWSLSDDSSGVMSIDAATGELSVNTATEGDYAIVTVTYTLYDSVNASYHDISTQAKVVITGSDATYSTIIYETVSGNDTEVQYTVTTKETSLPLSAYVVNDKTGDNSKTGSTVMGGRLTWTVTNTTNTEVASIDESGILDLSYITQDCILLITVSGATGDGIAASDATYKIYVKHVEYVAYITHDNGTTGDFTIPYGSSDIALDKLVYNASDELPGTTYTLNDSNAVWAVVSGDGAIVRADSAGSAVLDASACVAGTQIVIRLSGMTATTIPGEGEVAVTSTVPATTVTITVGAGDGAGQNDTVILDYDRPVTFNVLANDTYTGDVADLILSTAPEGLTVNDDFTMTYVPDGMITSTVSFSYTVTTSTGATFSASVSLVPAQAVYYEDSNSAFTYTNGKRGEWTTVGTETVQAQTDSLTSTDIFGYDANYASCATFSAGQIHKVTVASDKPFDDTYSNLNPYVEFSFYGTGFDMISLCSNNTGVFMIQVTDENGNCVLDGGTQKLVDTYYGYEYLDTAITVSDYAYYDGRYMKNEDGTYTPWDGISDASDYHYIYIAENENLAEDELEYVYVEQFYSLVEGSYVEDNAAGLYIMVERETHWQEVTTEGNDIYQIPVFELKGLPYGKYNVKIQAAYSAVFDHVNDGSYDFYFDSVRIYDPTGADSDYTYISMREEVIEDMAFGDGSGTPCAHESVSDWTLKVAATYTTSASTNGRGRFVKSCDNCGRTVESAYFYVTATATPDALDADDKTNNTAALSYSYSCDNAEVLAILNAQTFSATWSSSDAGVMTCSGGKITALGAGTAYARLQLKNADGTVYAHAIHTNNVTVTGCIHSWTVTGQTEVTCTANGYIYYQCSLCNLTKTETITALGHDLAESYSYDSTGHWYECSRCEEQVDFASHSYSYTVIDASTGRYTCSVCGYYYDESISTTNYSATFNVPSGASTPATIIGNTITLPAAVAAPSSYNAQNYVFAGWVTAAVDNVPTQPTIYAAGAAYTLTANTTFYALYTYSAADEGGNTYTLTDTLTTGDYVIGAVSDGAVKAMDSDGVSTWLYSTDMTPVSNVITTDDSTIIWTLTGTADSFTLKNKAADTYLVCSGTGSGSVKLGTSGSSLSATATGDGFNVANSAGALLSFNSAGYRMYTSTTGNREICFYKASGATYYTTVLDELGDNYEASLEPSELTVVIDEMCEVTPILTNNGAAVADYTVTYTSTNSAIAEIDENVVYGYAEGTVTVTAYFSVDGTQVATATCAIEVTKQPFTASFVVPNGATTPDALTGSSVTMPAAVVAPSNYNAQSYTFVGWVEATTDDTTTAPTFYAAGEEVSLTADTTFYALYTYTQTTGGSSGSGDYVLTDINSISASDCVVITMTTSAGTVYALSSANGSSSAPTAAVVTVANGKLSAEPADELKWNISNSGGTLTIYPEGSTSTWLYCTNTNNGVRVGTNSNSAFTIDSSSDYLKNTATSRYVGVYTSNPDWRCYENTTGNIANQTMGFYVSSGSGSGTGTTTSYWTTELAMAEGSTDYDVTVQADIATLLVGETTYLSATLMKDGSEISDYDTTVVWTSSNTNAVTITETADNLCTVTAVGGGTAQIRATYTTDTGTVYGYKTITVTAEVDETQPSSYSRIYNSGTRGVVCTSLSGTYADSYYTGSYTYENLSTQTGSTLLATLRTLMSSGHSSSSYNDCKEYAEQTDCQNEDGKVTLLYTGVEVDWNTSQNESGATSSAFWNREHVWPQSLGGFSTSGAGADLHHIRPDDNKTNSYRGNNLFGEVESGSAATGSDLVNNMIGGYYGGGYFEPLDEVKGDVARICMYVYVRYGNTYTECSDITNVFESVDTLLAWHELDPVDTWEMGRNVVIENLQGNRNVFIDYPELAWNLFNETVPSGYVTPSTGSAGTASAATAEYAVRGTAQTVESETRTVTRATETEYQGAAFIDGHGNIEAVDEMLAYGPKYELYLASGQAVIFYLIGGGEGQDLQIGAKAINGNANIVVSALNGTAGTAECLNQALYTANEMYYEFGTNVAWSGNTSSAIVIQNTGDGILSLTNLRYSGDAELELYVNASVVEEGEKVARMLLNGENPYIPESDAEDPEETVDPEEPAVPEDPTEPTYVLDENLRFTMEITVGAQMQVHYTILASNVSSYDRFYLEVNKEVAGGQAKKTIYGLGADQTPPKMITNPNTDEIVGYQITYTGINAKEMGDTFTTTLYAVAADGTIHYSNVNSASIKNYLMERVNDESAMAEIRTLAVDMLNYGAAAQIVLGYDTENLVNADLTAQQFAFGTQDIPDASDISAASAEGVKLMPSVTVESEVNLYLNAVYTPDDAQNLKYVVCDALTGEVLEEVPVTVIEGKYCQGRYSNVGAKEMRKVITATLYEGDAAVSQTLTWSVESYVASVRDNRNSSAEIVNMVNAMLIYGDSVAAYMNALTQTTGKVATAEQYNDVSENLYSTDTACWELEEAADISETKIQSRSEATEVQIATFFFRAKEILASD